MGQQNIPIELIDTNTWRDHKDARSQIVLYDDRILHEALSTCMRYDEDEITPSESEYYLREVYRKEAISGVSVSSSYHQKIKKTIYNIHISAIGVNDDIHLKFYDRKQAHEIYKTIWEWIFDE